MAMFFPLALVLMSASIFVAYRFGGAPRCSLGADGGHGQAAPAGKAAGQGRQEVPRLGVGAGGPDWPLSAPSADSRRD